ncbi:MAG TPA: hypothetical protein VHV83_01925 [Armatimonadota bacterium]|nr:hypothetical protein [Armatimonadota bacterium]
MFVATAGYNGRDEMARLFIVVYKLRACAGVGNTPVDVTYVALVGHSAVGKGGTRH